jgi:hypothetical protein
VNTELKSSLGGEFGLPIALVAAALQLQSSASPATADLAYLQCREDVG